MLPSGLTDKAGNSKFLSVVLEVLNDLHHLRPKIKVHSGIIISFIFGMMAFKKNVCSKDMCYWAGKVSIVARVDGLRMADGSAGSG